MIYPENKSIKPNFNEDIKTFKKHNFYKIIKYIRHKYPSFLLFVHICLSKYIFICKQNIHSSFNTTEVSITYENNHDIPSIQFWLYLIFINLICFIWEFLYKYFRYKRKNKISCKKIIHCITSSFTSVMILLSTMFYKDNHMIFNCFINYNNTIANIMFIISYIILIIYSIVEHYFCL